MNQSSFRTSMDPSLNTRQTNKTRAELGKVVKMIAAHTRSVLGTIRRNKLIISSCIQSSQQISLSQHKIYKNFRPIPHEIPKATARALKSGQTLKDATTRICIHRQKLLPSQPGPFLLLAVRAVTPNNPFEINEKSRHPTIASDPGPS